MEERVLVIGGAGYIGSQVAADLKQAGFLPVIVDNLSRGNRDIVERMQLPLEVGDITEQDFLQRVFREHAPAAVMHFAAFALVEESVSDPGKYYSNNLAATLKLLDAMRQFGVDKIIFSSTAATYGVPESSPISETVEQRPINPYGWSKLMVEQVLHDYAKAYGLHSVIFRYFNAAGAHPAGLVGERHDPETHLIPLAIKAALSGTEFLVYGSDYPTPDGTCVRDYIHVADVAQAHLLGLEQLLQGGNGGVFNIGNGAGYSVLEVLRTIEEVSGLTLNKKFVGRRAGDPPTLVATATKLVRELGWQPRFGNLRAIIETAWRWHQIDSRGR